MRRDVGGALLVTALWSSSWVLIKWGLVGMPPVLFAGIRYGAAALLLLPTLKRGELRAARGHLAPLLGLGAALYFFTQGAQYLSLAYFPAVVPALVLNQVPVLVAVASFRLLGERLRRLQLVGIATCAVGTWLYFGPKLHVGFDARLLVPIFGLVTNAAAALLGRSIGRARVVAPRVVTFVSMGFGSLLLLGVGTAIEPWPAFTTKNVAILTWLVLVNTSFAFTLWNKTLQTLSSVESSVINTMMLPEVAVFAWVFLGERIDARGIAALLLVLAGVVLVQVRRPTPA